MQFKKFIEYQLETDKEFNLCNLPIMQNETDYPMNG